MLKPHWNAKEIMAYVDCGKSKAYEIMATCRKYYNGAIAGMSECITRDSVLVYLQTSIEREIYIRKEVEK